MRKLFDFLRRKGLDREGVRYVIVGGLTTLINFSLTALIYSIMGINNADGSVASISTTTLIMDMASIPAPVVFANMTAISVSIVFAYFANKFIVFRKRCETKSELALEAIKFIGSRIITMALEIVIVLLFLKIRDINALLGKVASQVIVIILNYIFSKLIVFRRK